MDVNCSKISENKTQCLVYDEGKYKGKHVYTFLPDGTTSSIFYNAKGKEEESSLINPVKGSIFGKRISTLPENIKK